MAIHKNWIRNIFVYCEHIEIITFSCVYTVDFNRYLFDIFCGAVLMGGFFGSASLASSG